MIEFKIITSPDKSQQATYQHLGLELVIGREEGDMIVDDPGLGPSQLKVKVENDKATLENLDQTIEIRLNGKPIQGPTPLKEKDNVTMARTTINFSRLDAGPIPIPEPYVIPNAQERFSPGSKEKALLDVLEHLEKQALRSATSLPPLPGGAKPPLPPGVKPPLPPGVIPPLPPRKT